MRLFTPLAAAVALLATAPTAPAALILVDPYAGTSLANTITTGNVAGDRTERFGSQITPGVPIPLTWSSGGNFANATFTFGDAGLFISNIQNARTGGFAAQQHARIAFMVDVPTTVTFSGQYTNTNVADFSGRAFLQNALTDQTNFSNPIPSSSVFSTSFAAGPVPLNIQTATGTLTPGHTYVWDVFVGSLASGNPAGSTGTGSLSLSLTAIPAAVTPVPEPATLAVFGCLAAGSFGLRRWRRAGAV